MSYLVQGAQNQIRSAIIAAAEAAAAAVHLHGLSGDIAAAEIGEHSIRASDLIRFLHKAFLA
jgi:NAD(P)H-hydrate epimerase